MRALLILLLAIVAGLGTQVAGQSARTAPGKAAPTATAVFAGGCFWCTESDFDHIPGVVATFSGYTGGRLANPTYRQVSAGGTGHIEAVRVIYDPRRVSYANLVRLFLRTVDPLDGEGQFCDRGDMYRPAIFVANQAERRAAEQALSSASRELGARTAVALLPRAAFYPAEDYHQDYYIKNPVRYRFYRWNCGRDARIREVWSRAR